MIAALLAVALAQAPSQPPVRDARPAIAGTGTIRGRVVEADTGTPIRDCSLRLQASDQPTVFARTNEQGRFAFTKLPGGSYRLYAGQPGPSGRYVAIAYGAKEPSERGKAIEIVGSQVVESIEIRLPRGAVLTGRVIDEFGEPVTYVHVSALQRVSRGGPRPSLGYSGNSTDDLGRFRVFGLAPGEYFLVAETQRHGAPDQNPIRHLPTYFPSSLSLGEATPVRVRPGQEVGELEIRLIRGRTVNISGSLMNSRGQPVTRRSGHFILNENKFGSLSGQGVALYDDGTFEIRNVRPGTYTLDAGPVPRDPEEEVPPDAEFARVPVTVGESDIEGLIVITQPGATVAGEIVFDEPPPDNTAPLQVAANPASLSGPGFMWKVAKVGPDNTFVLKALFQPRLIRVSSPPKGYWLSSVTYDGLDITDRSIEFKPGATARLVITLTRRVSELSGRIVDALGRPALEAVVIAFGDDRIQWSPLASTTRQVESDGKGEFKLNGLRSGRYFVIAVPRNRRLPLIDEGADAWEALAKEATLVTIGNQECKTLDLTLVSDPHQ